MFFKSHIKLDMKLLDNILTQIDDFYSQISDILN